MGGEFDILEPIIYEEEIPNLFGGEPVTGEGKLYFESIDFDNGFCIMKQEATMNPDKAKKTMEAALKKIGFDVFCSHDNSAFEFLFLIDLVHQNFPKKALQTPSNKTS